MRDKIGVERNTRDQINTDWISQKIEQISPQLARWRRDFHQYPESGWTEYRTTAVIAKLLQEWGWKVYLGEEALDAKYRMGVPPVEVLDQCEERALEEGVDPDLLSLMKGGMTGVVAEWKTGRPGPVFAFRFDIDCNDVDESTEMSHLPNKEGFASLHPNCMHACGHDGHGTIGLGLAQLIAMHGELLTGTIRLLFQPAEEGSRGALAMVEKGWLDDVNYFLSGHIGFRVFQLGEVVLNTTGFYATTKWDAEFLGRAAHAGGNPELGKNALLAAATAVMNLHAISRHSEGVSRINVGRMIAGTGRNVVPGKARLELEVRGETEKVNHYMSEEAVRILRAAAAMYDVDLHLDKVGEASDASGDPAWANQLHTIFEGIPAVHTLHPSYPLGASEDVVQMMKRVQERGGVATYLMFGSPLAGMHHQSHFDFDERVMAIAVEGFFRTVLEVNGQ